MSTELPVRSKRRWIVPVAALCVIGLAAVAAYVALVAHPWDQPPSSAGTEQEQRRYRVRKREELIARIKKQGDLNDPNGGVIVVGVEDYFAGNEELGSIGANLIPHPGIDRFRAVLCGVQSRDDVQAVLVRIIEVVEGEWPYSDTVYILSSAPRESVAGWLSELKPDEMYEGYHLGKPPAAPDPRPGMKVYGAWWD